MYILKLIILSFICNISLQICSLSHISIKMQGKVLTFDISLEHEAICDMHECKSRKDE